MKGTGTWTVQTALSLAVPVTGIAEAVFARGLSSEADLREEAAEAGLRRPRRQAEPHRRREEGLHRRTSARPSTPPRSSPTPRASTRSPPPPKEYGWDIDLAAVARIWRGGCIIRAKFLDRHFRSVRIRRRPTCRCCSPRTSRTPSKPPQSPGVTWWPRPPSTVDALTPAFASSLSYFDEPALHKRLPAGLIQGPARQLLRRPHLPACGPAGRVPHAVAHRAGPRGDRSLIFSLPLCQGGYAEVLRCVPLQDLWHMHIIELRYCRTVA